MAMNNPYKAYKQNQVQTASQQELLLMLYRGALKFLDKAKAALEEKNIENSHHYLVRTQNIMAELMSSLNYERSEDEVSELVGGLYNVYGYMRRRLIQANVDKDTAPVEEVEKMFRALLQAWEESVQPAGAAAAAASEAVEPSEVQGGVSYRG